MKKLQLQDIYIINECYEKMPSQSGFYLTDGSRGQDYYSKGNSGFDDDADYWLEKVDGKIILSKEELTELLNKAIEHGIHCFAKRETLKQIQNEFINKVL